MFAKIILNGIVISVVFLISVSSLFCSQVSLDNIQIPEEYGWITSRSGVAKSIAEGKTRLIISIQDAHCNYSAQKNLYYILKSLIDSYGVKLIGVEGGSGDCGLSYLRDNATKEKRVEVAEKFLKNGEISGEEYLDIVSDYDIMLWGLEDKKLYNDNLASFYEIDGLKAKLQPCIDAIKDVVVELKSKIYPDSLLGFEDRERAYNNKKIGLDDFLIYLCDSADSVGLGRDYFPTLYSYVKTMKDRKRISFVKAQSESDSMLMELSEMISDQSYNELKSKAASYNEKKLNDIEFFLYLGSLARQYNLNTREKYPNLHSYLGYIRTYKDFDSEKMLSSLAASSDKLKSAMLKNGPDGQYLKKIAENIDLIDRLLNIRVYPKEFASIKKTGLALFPTDYIRFLEKEKSRYNIGAALPIYSGMISQDLDKLFRFYETGRKRDEAFFKNMVLKMKERAVDVACIVAGGFHSEGLKDLLAREGYNCVVIFPRITEPTDMNRYASVLKTKSPLKLRSR